MDIDVGDLIQEYEETIKGLHMRLAAANARLRQAQDALPVQQEAKDE